MPNITLEQAEAVLAGAKPPLSTWANPSVSPSSTHAAT